MPTVNFTYALKRFYPELRPVELSVDKVSEVITEIDKEFPGIESYLVDELGRLRKHVNIFVDGDLIKDREKLSDSISENSEVYIKQALSGG